MADRLEMQRRGARIEMQTKNVSVELQTTCASCRGELERSEWSRGDTRLDINICVSCALSVNRRQPCLDGHTFTAMFRIHELSFLSLTKYGHVLDKNHETNGEHQCDKCGHHSLPQHSSRCGFEDIQERVTLQEMSTRFLRGVCQSLHYLLFASALRASCEDAT